MIKSIILDAGGVICYPSTGDWNTPVRFNEIIGDNRLSLVSKEKLNDIMTESSRIYLDESMPIVDTDMEFVVRRNYILDVAKRAGWTITDVEADVLARDMTENDARYGFYDDAREGVYELGKNREICLLSNSMPSIKRVFDSAGYWELFDYTVISTDIAAAKPDKKMYAAILELNGRLPSECVFVDDNIANIESAAECGLNVIHMCREGKSDWHGYVCENLFDVKRLIESEEYARGLL